MLGECEQFFLELMKVPRMESKLRVFLFKIQFNAQVSKLNQGLKTVNSATTEVRKSVKLREIIKRSFYLWKTFNQGTDRVGFMLDSLLEFGDIRASNSEMTLMHYLCKVLACKLPELLDFHVDLVSLESASKVHIVHLFSWNLITVYSW
ncbi:putative formin, FH2 domain-containing protein [Helianthus annuus]|nr:putative formin, FH2 domain-containing protein [Helianthus annuus]